MLNLARENMSRKLEISGIMKPGYEEILTNESIAFVADLAEKFGGRANELLEARKKRQQELNNGKLPDFLPETKHIRDSDWKVAPIPADLQDRRVEITGPVDRKMVINALNSGAKVFMADFEDANSPTWDNNVSGQINMRDAVNGTISFSSPEGKIYSLNKDHAVLLVRPRGWHLMEKHLKLAGQPIHGAFMDFGLYFFHNAKNLLAKGSGPYFYIPKLESHLEARLWNDIFTYAETALGMDIGTIKATVLIETIMAAFEMDEILFEMRNHIVGLNCGRWDYIFSFIKKFNNFPDMILPDRSEVVMTTHFLRSYSLLLIKTCHKRGAFAMGGMAAFIPIKNDEAANNQVTDKVRADKEREAGDGHDGTWVAHPGLIPTAMEVFNRLMPTSNQLHKIPDVNITAADLLQIPAGKITETGLRGNISVSLQYIEAWLGGNGCVPINNLMEDAATAEISRTQIWQWIRYPKGVLEDGRKVTFDLYKQIASEELVKIREKIGAEKFDNGHFKRAAEILDNIVSTEDFVDFVTLPALEYIN